MIHPAEIVLFHLRHNGDIFLAHWYLWVLVVLIVLRLLLVFFSER